MPKEAKFKRKGEDTSTATILKNLLVLVPAYYATFYIWVAIVSSAMAQPIDGLEPFAFATMNPAAGGRPAVAAAGSPIPPWEVPRSIRR